MTSFNVVTEQVLDKLIVGGKDIVSSGEESVGGYAHAVFNNSTASVEFADDQQVRLNYDENAIDVGVNASDNITHLISGGGGGGGSAFQNTSGSDRRWMVQVRSAFSDVKGTAPEYQAMSQWLVVTDDVTNSIDLLGASNTSSGLHVYGLERTTSFFSDTATGKNVLNTTSIITIPADYYLIACAHANVKSAATWSCPSSDRPFGPNAVGDAYSNVITITEIAV